MPHSDQTQLQLDKFASALMTLKETAAQNEERVVRDSLLLRFVYTFEMAWQSVRAVLRDRGDDETPRVAFEALATGFKVGFLTDVDLWKRLREARNGVSHAYDEQMAIALAAMVRVDAIPEFERLLARLRKA
ncbi:MAG: HI0074 family nucleotidyltransferase substrate-binding subunit [Burkholderiaceae bacterium]